MSVVSRSGREVVKAGIEISDSATVADLQEAIYKRSTCLICFCLFLLVCY